MNVSLSIPERNMTVALGDFIQWESKAGNAGYDKTKTTRMGVVVKITAKYKSRYVRNNGEGTGYREVYKKYYSVTCKTKVDKYRMSSYFGEITNPQIELVGNIRKFEHVTGEIPSWLMQLSIGESSLEL